MSSKPIGTIIQHRYLRDHVLTLSIALLSVYDKTGLIPFATALSNAGVRLLGSGGTAKKIREAGIAIEYVFYSSKLIAASFRAEMYRT